MTSIIERASGYIKLGIVLDDDDDIEDKDIRKLDPNRIKKSVNSLRNGVEHIYEYIRECMYLLRRTWYSQFYLKYND